MDKWHWTSPRQIKVEKTVIYSFSLFETGGGIQQVVHNSSVSECLYVCLLCSVFMCFCVSSFHVWGDCVSPLSMSQRAEPGPIYKVSWPEGSRLGRRPRRESCRQHIQCHFYSNIRGCDRHLTDPRFDRRTVWHHLIHPSFWTVCIRHLLEIRQNPTISVQLWVQKRGHWKSWTSPTQSHQGTQNSGTQQAAQTLWGWWTSSLTTQMPTAKATFSDEHQDIWWRRSDQPDLQ